MDHRLSDRELSRVSIVELGVVCFSLSLSISKLSSLRNYRNQGNFISQHHAKYQCKSRSDNAAHVYSVADSAFQDVMLNEESQHILLAGESNSGKTTSMLHLVEHLTFLGKVSPAATADQRSYEATCLHLLAFQGLHDTGARMLRAVRIIHAFTNASTPLNADSTRCVLQIQTTFGSTGKASGAIFWLYQLEKWRVSTRDRWSREITTERSDLS